MTNYEKIKGGRMSRYIKATDAAEICSDKLNIPLSELVDTFADIPTADVVEVVRCKDCKHLMFSDCYGECAQAHMGIVRPDDFCSYGERKDKE